MAKDSKEIKEPRDPVADLRKNLGDAKQDVTDADGQQDALMVGLDSDTSSSALPADPSAQDDQEDGSSGASPAGDGKPQSQQSSDNQTTPDDQVQDQDGDEGVDIFKASE